jgi:hypothetical protein
VGVKPVDDHSLHDAGPLLCRRRGLLLPDLALLRIVGEEPDVEAGEGELLPRTLLPGTVLRIVPCP